ncbi:GNAT family protein [Streptomyces sp. NPDC005407]|uniref:GNAT family N-acetyltransferase n=1 Tax=Streptomyces sp. NPDC005407 TaxID=3155340 RepID=UPI0033BB7D77
MYPVSRSSQRLELRELHPEDVDAVLAIYGSAVATEHLSFDPRSRSDVEGIVTRSIAAAEAEPRTEYALAVVRLDSSELIGFGRIAMDPHQPRGATFGFALEPTQWGSGYGVETVQLLQDFGFEDLGLHRIWGARSPHNNASAKTMLKAGMTEEGVIREHIQKGGEWRDSVVHSILDREWADGANRVGRS